MIDHPTLTRAATAPGTPSATAPAPDAVRETLEETLRDALLSTFLVRGRSLADAEVTAVDFTADLARDVVADVGAYVRALTDRELVPYDPSYRPGSHEALVDELASLPALAAVHERVLGDDVPLDGAARDDGRAGERGPLLAMAHVLTGADGGRVAVYRLKGEGIATRRVRGLRALMPRGGYWEPVGADQVLYYSPAFDAAVLGEHVLFTRVTTLAQRLQAPERSRQMARATFDAAVARVAIEGVEQLTDAVAREPAMIAKMAQLARQFEADPAYAQRLTTTALVDFVDRNPQFGVATTGEGEARRLVFESSPQTRFLLVKLLADDLLRSDLTDRRYEAGSKHRVAD